MQIPEVIHVCNVRKNVAVDNLWQFYISNIPGSFSAVGALTEYCLSGFLAVVWALYCSESNGKLLNVNQQIIIIAHRTIPYSI